MKLVAVTALIVLAAAAPAAAKGPIELRVCGASECATFKAPFAGMADAPQSEHARLVTSVANLERNFDFTGPPPLASYYALTLSSDFYDWSDIAYVPEHQVARVGSNWVNLSGGLADALTEAIGGLEPKAAPEIRRAVVNGQESRDPEAYALAFGELPPAQAPPPGTPKSVIRLETAEPTPWTDGRPLEYYPSTDTISREGEWVRASEVVSTRIEDDLEAVKGDAGGRTWPGYLTGAALVLAVAAVAWLALRRRRPWDGADPSTEPEAGATRWRRRRRGPAEAPRPPRRSAL